MIKNYYVYKHTSPNGKIYIGITGQESIKRWKSNGIGYQTQSYFYKSILKYGWENFKHEILFDGLTKEEAEEIEIDLIKKYKTNDPEFGYNIRNGGSLSTWREDSREKLRQANIGKHLSEETKKKLHDYNINKKLSEETKSKISETLTGYKRGKFSEEHKLKLSLAKKGRPATESQLKNLQYNKFGSENKHAKKVNQYDLDNNFIRHWDCISDACRYLNVNVKNSSSITSVCKFKQHTAYGFIWRYAE